MKKILIILSMVVIISSCSFFNNKNIKEEPLYSAPDYTSDIVFFIVKAVKFMPF